MKTKTNIKHYISLYTCILTAATVATGLALASTSVSADDIVDNVSITVPIACTMGGEGMSSHTAEVANGTYRADIGTTTMNVFCNDKSGFSVYATGFTGDKEGTSDSNKLIGTSISGNSAIITGTATTASDPDVSNWAMKIATDSEATNPMILQNDFGMYHVVPSDYTKIATRMTGTDVGESAIGSTLTSTYAIYISKTQVADTYTGKVKYTLVHPNDATPPIFMQDLPSAKCTTSPKVATDNRDGEEYLIQRLADGKCWMLDNLRLDLASVPLATLQNNTNASNTSLGYLKNGGGNSSDRYAITGVEEWSGSQSYSSNGSYSDPLIASEGDGWTKDSIKTSYGVGSGKIGIYYNYCAASAGTYCYGDGSNIYGAPSGNATEDICPTGWKIPSSVYDYNNEDPSAVYGGDYYELGIALGISYSSTPPPFKGTIYQTSLSIPLSGNFIDGLANWQNNYGIWWSSSNTNELYSGAIMWGSIASKEPEEGMDPYYPAKRSEGNSVRCVLNE